MAEEDDYPVLSFLLCWVHRSYS